MKRFPAYDPVEYIDWAVDAKTFKEYQQLINKKPLVKEAASQMDEATLKHLYQGMVRARLYDVTLKRWVRTGVLTKAWLGIGEEACTIGAVHALKSQDVVGPMIRNQSACFEKGISIADCLRVYLATGDTITKGRDLHIGDLEHNVVSPISHVADLLPVCAGFALAFQKRREDRVALTWCGDGATATGAFHEGIGMAASLQLPYIIVVQDNSVALGTKRSEVSQKALESIHKAYGVTGIACDGNNVLDVYAATQEARNLCVSGNGPVVIHMSTFRMGGHATHDEAEARKLFDEDVFAQWGKRCPVGNFEEYIRKIGKSKSGLQLSDSADNLLSDWEQEVSDQIDEAEKAAIQSRENAKVDPSIMLNDVYKS